MVELDICNNGLIRIYISSTYRDLKEHRALVGQALRRQGLLDVAMEYYQADERPPVDRCLADVASCDLYIGLVAWHRGYVPEQDNPRSLSITEMEYEAAAESDVDRLIFVLTDEAPWLPAHMDRDLAAVEEFRARVTTECSADRFSSPDDLVAKVTQAVADWERRHTSAGSQVLPNGPTDLSLYRAAIRRRYEVLDLDALTPPEVGDQPTIKLQSVFVEPTLEPGMQSISVPAVVRRRLSAEGQPMRGWGPSHPSRVVKPGPALSVLASSENRHVVLGQPGSGKSTLVRHLALGIDTEDPNVFQTIGSQVPFVVELRHYVPDYRSGAVDSPLAFLHRLAKADEWGMQADALNTVLSSGSLVLFDGLDEVFDPALRTEVTRQIIAFADRHPTATIVVTSRIVGYQPRLLDAAGFAHSSIAPLDRAQIDRFLSRWYTEVGVADEKADALRNRLLQAYDDLPSIRQLAGSPLLLTLLALINRHRELPRERVRLYEHAAQVLVHHWDVSKEISRSSTDLDEQDKTTILQRLALEMQSDTNGAAGNYVHRYTLNASFARYVQDRYKLDALTAKELADELIERFRSRNYVLVLYGADLYGFVHRALLEYFAARAIQTQFEKSRQITLAELTALVLNRCRDSSWNETLLLLLSLLDASVTKPLITSLLDTPLPNSLYEEPRVLLLALGALTDVREQGTHAANAERALSRVAERFDQALTDPPWHWSVMSGYNHSLFQLAVDVARRWPKPDLALKWVGDRADAPWPDPETPSFGDPFGSLYASVGLYLNRLAGGLAVAAEGDENHMRLVVLLGFAFRAYMMHDRPAHRVVGMWGWCFHPLSFSAERDTIFDGTNAVVGLLRQDPSEAVRWHATDALLTLTIRTGTSHVKVLQEAAQSDASAEVRAAALTAYTGSEVRLSGSDAVSADVTSFIESFLDDDSPLVRVAAINSILSVPYDEERLADQALRLLQTDPDVTVRWRMAALFGKQLVNRSGTWGTITSVALADSHERVREEAVAILADSFLPHDGSEYFILKTLESDRSPSVRARALRAVLGTPATFEPVRDLLFRTVRSDRSSDVRDTALSALLGRGARDAEDLLLLLYHTLSVDANGDNRLKAAHALVKRDPNRGRVDGALEDRVEQDRSKRVRAELAALRASLD